MITSRELEISNMSYTNKDFQTAYPEVVEVIKTLTDKWNPETTNESDPLLVLLKLWGFFIDKNNYNIDKNILEGFSTSATQDFSFRSLVEVMNGYNMRYYNSAKTKISVMYSGSLSNSETIELKAFETKFTDVDNKLTFTLIKPVSVYASNVAFSDGDVIEGEPVDLTINGETTILLENLDSNNRLLLPITKVATNGIFVKNVEDTAWDRWKITNNLNTEKSLTPCFKFGIDLDTGLPYIQFPDDINELIMSGLNVKYTPTNGVQGNIPINTLTVLLSPSELTTSNGTVVTTTGTTKQFFITNSFATSNGTDPETIDSAYSNSKKTIGVFNTLVACRDFMNYIYNYISESSSTPIVSNVLVTDRRTDINYTVPIVSYNSKGNYTRYELVKNNGQPLITPYDLVMYPLPYINNVNSDANYNASFNVSKGQTSLLQDLIDVVSTDQAISHTYLDVVQDAANGLFPDYIFPIYLFKNKYKLDVKISTTYKVSNVEQASILLNVKYALYSKFNSRELDFGEEIPFDTILDTIQNADPRIKNVSLADPDISTWVLTTDANNPEVELNSDSDYYMQYLARNVLAGKVPAFEYDDSFDYKLGQVGYTGKSVVYEKLRYIEPSLTIDEISGQSGTYNYTLKENQVVQIMSPNYSVKTVYTYGVYYQLVNIPSNAIQKDVPYELSGSEQIIWNTTINNTSTTGQLTSGDIVRFNFAPSNYSSQEMLSTSQTIEVLSENSIIIDNTKLPTLYAYWFMNNESNELFETGSDSVILGDNEYFIYTDPTYTQLQVFGSGTKIEKSGLSYITDWSIDKTNLISIDTLNSSTLATYSSINWRPIILSTNDYIKVTEQQVVTLTDGDRFEIRTDCGLSSLTVGGDPLTEDLYYYLSTNPTQEEKIAVGNSSNWFIKTGLDINSGPSTSQQLKSESSSTTTSNYTESIHFKYDNDATETISPSANGDTFFSLSNLYQILGNSIDLSSTDINGDKIYPTNLFLYVQGSISGTATASPTENSGYIVEFNGNQNITFPVLHSGNNTSMFMVYWDAKANDNSVITLTHGVNINVFNVTSAGNVTTYTPSSTLQVGVNVVVVDNSQSSVTLTASGVTSKESIYVFKLKQASGLNDAFELGTISDIIDNDFIHTIINMSSTVDSTTYSSQFNYVADISNLNAIESSDYKDANTLFDKNNIANRFTISQIDFENSSFSIVRASRTS